MYLRLIYEIRLTINVNRIIYNIYKKNYILEIVTKLLKNTRTMQGFYRFIFIYVYCI